MQLLVRLLGVGCAKCSQDGAASQQSAVLDVIPRWSCSELQDLRWRFLSQWAKSCDMPCMQLSFTCFKGSIMIDWLDNHAYNFYNGGDAEVANEHFDHLKYRLVSGLQGHARHKKTFMWMQSCLWLQLMHCLHVHWGCNQWCKVEHEPNCRIGTCINHSPGIKIQSTGLHLMQSKISTAIAPSHLASLVRRTWHGRRWQESVVNVNKYIFILYHAFMYVHIHACACSWLTICTMQLETFCHESLRWAMVWSMMD